MASYTEQSSGSLPFYNQGIQALLGKGQDQASKPYSAYQGELVAGFTPQQLQAFGMVNQNLGNYQPLLNQSAAATNAAITGAQYDPSQMAQFMNPYTSGVVDEIGRLGNESFQNQVAPAISSAFGGLGQYGSARQGAMLSDAAARNQREVLGAQANALNTGYNNAANQYLNWGQLGAQTGLTGGAQLGNLAQAQQQAGLNDVSSLLTAGQTQQQNIQENLNAKYGQWQKQQDFPWQQLNQWGSLFGAGSTPQQSTSWSTQFKKGGLAKFADGGDFPRVSKKEQAARDEQRLILLLNELDNNPNDPDLISEIERMGVPRESLAFSNQSEMSEQDSPIEDGNYQMVASSVKEVPQNNPSIAGMNDRVFNERMAMLERARKTPELQPIEQKGLMGRIGEAMLRSSGQSVGHPLQVIGQTGKEFYEGEDRRQAENQRRAIARLGIEDKITPDLQRLSSLSRSGGTGAISVYGKIAQDEGFVPGSQEYNERVNELAERDFGVRQQTANTSRGHLGARRQEQEYKFGPPTIGPLSAGPGDGGVTGTAVSEAPPAIHPGIQKYAAQGMPRKDAQERWETEQKEYDKMREARSDNAATLNTTDLDVADTLNARIERNRTLPPAVFALGPETLPVVTSAFGSKTGEDRESLNAIGARMIPALTKGLTPVSNVDAQSMAKAGIGAGNSYVVNKNNIQRARSATLLIKEQDQFFDLAQEAGISPSKAQAEWNKYIRSNPLFNSKRANKDGALVYNVPLEKREVLLRNYLGKISSGPQGLNRRSSDSEEIIEIRPEDLQ